MGNWKNLGLLSALASATAVSRRQEPSSAYPDHGLLADCPGYSVSNIDEHAAGVTADLTLAGEACNVYGDDIKELTLEVTYESGEYMAQIHLSPRMEQAIM